ncbi:MAG TPA: hypothetical protein VGU69_02440, partial [Rhizomicrobium sp.]|nr:hypothetical protein [Rhizomicrobium sp.]
QFAPHQDQTGDRRVKGFRQIQIRRFAMSRAVDRGDAHTESDGAEDRAPPVERMRRSRIKTDYYNADIHAAAFALPEWIKRLVP